MQEIPRIRRKKLNLSQVGASTRMQIVELIATKSRTHREIGDMFGIRASSVSKLSSDFNRSRSTIVKR